MAPRPPPALLDDVIIEILLRLPPDDIACLPRASLVCKPWRRLLSDRAFLRRYRDIHGAPPVLGFLFNDYSMGACRPRFVPTTPASPLISQSASAGSPTTGRTLDCRHGRVLLHQHGYSLSLIVWDPVTGKQRFFKAPVHPDTDFTAAVLCASNGCDHLDCSSGQFHVVLVERTYNHKQDIISWPFQHVEMAQASLYSSATGMWRSVSASIEIHPFPWGTQSLLDGDTVFFMVGVGQILKYDLARGSLSAIRVPLELVRNMILCHAEDGGPGVAALEGNSLRMLSWRTNPDGITKWAKGKVIELDSVIPTSPICEPFTTFSEIGFAEGTGYIFISANDSIFSVEVKSGRINKTASGKFGPIFPFMRFYIPDIPSAKLQLQTRIE